MIKASKEHLHTAHKNYWDHLFFAVKAGFLLLYAGVVSVTHGFLPFLFKFEASKIVMQLADKVLQQGNFEELPSQFKENWDCKRK